MRIVMFYHSLLSDWNHGNAHFLRGVVSDLLGRWHEVKVYEPHDSWSNDSWSLKNLIAERGEDAIREFREAYPAFESIRYRPDQLDLDEALDGADLVIVHEWNDHELVSRVGRHRARTGNYRLLFHDTHHRSITDADGMAAYDLSSYDGVLAFGRVIRDFYMSRGWAERAWVWHEAADIRMFCPRAMSVAGESSGVDKREDVTEEAPGKTSPHQLNAPASAYPAPPALSVSNVRQDGGSSEASGNAPLPGPTTSWQLVGHRAPHGDMVWIGNWGDGKRAEELCEFLIEPPRRLNLKTSGRFQK